MKQWRTIIAKDKGDAIWQLIGDIGQWQQISSASFSSDLAALEKKHATIQMKLHSAGGSLVEGIQMYNRLRSSSAEINIDVEGLAASMGSALFMAGQRRRMARHARLMIHQGSGKVTGSASKILEYGLQLKKWNNTLAEIYAEAIGWKHPDRNAQWVKENWLSEGKDTWFTAEEALQAGLVHQIYDSANPLQPLPAEASYEQMVAHYDQILNSQEMKKEELLFILASAGISLPETVTALDGPALAGPLKEALRQLKQKADKAEALQAQLDEQDQKAFEARLKQAVKAGMITETMTGRYYQLAEQTSKQEVIALLDDLLKEAVNPNIEAQLAAKKQKPGSQQDREGWDYKKWEEQDPKGLLTLADEDPETFQQLVENY